MIKLPLIATLLLAAAAPAVAAQEKTIFTQDGVTYAYSTTKVGESTVYRGRAMPGADFYYVVRKGQVVGNTDGMPVSFRVQDAVASQGETAVAPAH